MTTLANVYGGTTESGDSNPLKIAAPVGYNVQLFKGGLWMLQPQGILTVGTGNAALTAVAKASGKTFEVQAQVGNNVAVTHTYVGGALILKLGTDGGGAANTTATAAAAYLKAQSAVMADFADFLAGGTGATVMSIAAAAPVPTVNCWIPGSTAGANCVAGGRGEQSVDNRVSVVVAGSGLPGYLKATGKLGIFKFQNSAGADEIKSVWVDVYCAGDIDVALTSNSSARSRLGKSIAVETDGVFVDTTR